ncbi:hypothetical protein J2X36_003554 [Methylobacterium sp. BE186]|uniref:hypothetical protein n=1 Tax=Methylobacterium sp. BE186 TaxID=2817715 RepID=UPI00285B35C0|nr:hypothetical protein [Methylobacterium sp. BE186]MDR7038783.1 hypothetical protein [Methylobacterium sp. BE186]
MRRIILGLALAAGLSAGHAAAGDRSARPRLCPEDAPEGVRLPSRPGCGREPLRAPARGDGFVDLGNGVQVRINGRASADFGVRR